MTIAGFRSAPLASVPSKIVVTPTIDTVAYASGDTIANGVIPFPNAVLAAGGTAILDKLVIVDKAAIGAAGELWLFADTVTPAAMNAPHSISDADAALCVGVVPFGAYFASALNSVSIAKTVDLPFTLVGTTLYGILVTRATPTYGAANALDVILHLRAL